MYVESHPDLSEIITSRCGWLDLCGMTTIYRAFYQSLDQAWSLHSIFFSIKVLFHGHWQLTGQQGKGGDHLLFHSTTSTRSRTLRHLFATLHVRWLSRIFNRNACVYQTATRWDLPPYQITIWLIDDVMLIFVCLRYDLILAFFVTAIWDGKPVNSNSHRLSLLYYKWTD